jgi:hypothetical protein
MKIIFSSNPNLEIKILSSISCLKPVAGRISDNISAFFKIIDITVLGDIVGLVLLPKLINK